MKFNTAGYNKLIIATVDDKGAEMYYYGYGKLEHYGRGGHLNPSNSSIEWMPGGEVKRSAKYPTFDEEITSGQQQITGGSSSIRSGRNDRMG